MPLTLDWRRGLNLLTGRKPAAKPFAEMAARYRERLLRWPLRASGGGAKIGIVITPWLSTPVPFFSLECARLLAERGAEVTLLWDASNVFLNAAKSSEVETVREVLAQFEDHFRTLDVSALAPAAEADLKFVELLVYENAVRQMRGEAPAREFLGAHPECLREMQTHGARIHTLLATERFDWVLVPGGVWAASGLYAQIARDLGAHFTTFDSGVGLLFVAHDGAAAHFGDIPQTFAEITSKASARERAWMIERAWEQLQIRMDGRDPFKLQPARGQVAKCDLVAPLNYRSDSAALFRQRLFASVTDWLTQLLDWLGTQPDISVAIRQHPCERIPEYRGSDAWHEVFAPYKSLGERLRFVAAEDPVNTYDLMGSASAVLPFTSRVGIEAAMTGKAVILGTNCYYQDCGFAENPATTAEYFDAISRAVRGESVPDTAARENAALVYYLAECCLGLKTNFTPQPQDFREWVQLSPDDLWSTSAGQDLAEALLARRSVACLQHRRNFS